jgi:hypothetical protein
VALSKARTFLNKVEELFFLVLKRARLLVLKALALLAIGFATDGFFANYNT